MTREDKVAVDHIISHYTPLEIALRVQILQTELKIVRRAGRVKVENARQALIHHYPPYPVVSPSGRGLN